MVGFYRKKAYKTDEVFTLSRSKIDLYIQCDRCFYLDRKLLIARPPGFPFNLNSAVDHLLKKEFDVYRLRQAAHPLMTEYQIDAVPFAHEEMDIWRENFKGVQFHHEDTNFIITGAVDDIWVNEQNELHVVDYKSTSKDSEINLDAGWQDGYKRQMEVYQWLLRQNGFTVSNTGYFVYANGQKDREAFNAKLEFDMTIIPYEGNDEWIEPTLYDIKSCLGSDIIPKANSECDYCNYVESASGIVQPKSTPQKASETKRKKDEDVTPSTLF
jgi:hypothetical protein